MNAGIPREARHTFSAAGATSEKEFAGAIYRDLLPRIGEEGAIDEAIRRYDSALHHYDTVVGALLATLEETGLATRTVVIVTSDHGQDLFQHAMGDHGIHYDDVLQIPLLIVDPALQGVPRRIDAVVQTIDIAPTVLARAGIPADTTMDGQSLLPLLRGDDAGFVPRPVWSYTNGCNASVRADGFKLMIREYDDLYLDLARRWYGRGEDHVVPLQAWMDGLAAEPLPPPRMEGDNDLMRTFGFVGTPSGFGGVTGFAGCRQLTVELYDLTADPDEHVNLAMVRPDVSRALGVPLLRWMEERRSGQGGDRMMSPLSDAQRKMMQERGYWKLVETP